MSNKPSYKETHGQTRVGSFLEFLKEKGIPAAGKILEEAGELTGKQWVEKIGKAIQGNTELSEEDKNILMQQHALDLEFYRAETQRMEIETAVMAKVEAEITQRWTSDNQSDSWMAKNIRPMSCAAVLLVFLASYMFNGFGRLNFNPSAAMQDTMTLILLAIIGAFFGGRTIEKIRKMRSPLGKLTK